MNKVPKFRNTDGSFTHYAFACGHTQTKVIDNVEVTLYLENCCWHIRAFDTVQHKRVFWHSCRLLTEARKLFNRLYIPLNSEYVEKLGV